MHKVGGKSQLSSVLSQKKGGCGYRSTFHPFCSWETIASCLFSNLRPLLKQKGLSGTKQRKRTSVICLLSRLGTHFTASRLTPLCKALVPTPLLRTNEQPRWSRIKAQPKCLNEAIWNQKTMQVWAEKWQLLMAATTWRICCHLPPCWLWMRFHLVGPQPTAEPLLKSRM